MSIVWSKHRCKQKRTMRILRSNIQPTKLRLGNNIYGHLTKSKKRDGSILFKWEKRNILRLYTHNLVKQDM